MSVVLKRLAFHTYGTRCRGDKTKFFALIKFLPLKNIFLPLNHVGGIATSLRSPRVLWLQDEKKLGELLAKAGLSHLKPAFVREKVR